MSEDNNGDEVCENCGGDCKEAPDEFSGRVVQGLAELIGIGLDGAVTAMHERIEGTAKALGLVQDVSDEALQRYILMATYESMMTHAAAARALLVSTHGVEDEVMAARADLLLSAGRTGVAEMIAEEERESAQQITVETKAADEEDGN